MKYATVIHYLADKEKVEALRPEHRKYLQQLKADGKLAASGPFSDGWGALIVYEAASEEEALSFLKADPFHDGGIFLDWTMRPWNPVIVNRDLFPA